MLSFPGGDNMATWMDVKEASGKLHIAERTVRHWIHQGKLTAKKEGGKWLIDESSLTAIGKAHAGGSAKETTIAVPLEHYDALLTRLAQLEAESQQYRDQVKLLEAPKRVSFWRRIFRIQERGEDQ
jgi:excisionase family DNA binding protein